jgi:hypothetical protein
MSVWTTTQIKESHGALEKCQQQNKCSNLSMKNTFIWLKKSLLPYETQQKNKQRKTYNKIQNFGASVYDFYSIF